jgi:hypothetical protein
LGHLARPLTPPQEANRAPVPADLAMGELSERLLDPDQAW